MVNAMNISCLRLFVFFFFLFQFQSAFCQTEESIHNFKITGKNRILIPFHTDERYERSVEYDKNSPDHLNITDFRKNGSKSQTTQLLFKGKKFNLGSLSQYINSQELLRDGIQSLFREDNSIASELIFKDDILRQQTTYFSNGNKELSFFCNNEILDGEMKMWYPEGQLSFTGSYKDNLKDGSFESFDQAGNTDRKGVYQKGKLISGEAVLHDLVYNEPEVKAQFIGGDSAFDEYLKMKTSGFEAVKAMGENELSIVNLRLNIGKAGQINKLDIRLMDKPSDQEIIEAAFKEIPRFRPALIEGVPVRSTLDLNLLLSNKGLHTDNLRKVSLVENINDSIPGDVYVITEEMPEFPGGMIGLRNFIAKNIRYPSFAAQNRIQGKVLVQFIILEDGTVSNINVKKSVHPALDKEAIRLIKLLPKWTPGKQKGEAVRVSFTVPINFVVQ